MEFFESKVFVGNVGKDQEYDAEKKQYKFSVGVNRYNFTTKVKETIWINCKTGMNFDIKKGQKVLAIGFPSKFTTKEGNEMYSLDLQTVVAL